MAGVLKIERRTYHGLQNSECEDVYRGHERQRDHDEDGSVPDQVSLKLFYKKTVGDIVNLVRSKKLVPEDAIQAFIKDVEAL